ncbi:MAG: hypothetical protein Q9213_007077 [Squamulea squamosa]
MSEPLSSTASVLAVAVCVTESAKFLFKFFHDVARVPEKVRQLLSALDALQKTLAALQQYSTTLGPELQFSPHFCHTLSECRTQLTHWLSKLARIDSRLNKLGASHHIWERKTRRSWQKIKWLIAAQGITDLHTASSVGYTDLVKVLINAGADVNAADEDGETPLHRALSVEGNYDTAKLLIQNGADLANVAVGDRTPLHAIFNGTMSQVVRCEEWMEDICPDSD